MVAIIGKPFTVPYAAFNGLFVAFTGSFAAFRPGIGSTAAWQPFASVARVAVAAGRPFIAADTFRRFVAVGWIGLSRGNRLHPCCYCCT